MLKVHYQGTGLMFGQTNKHLKENKMTYWQHCKFANSVAVALLRATVCLVIHSIFPGLFTDTGSNIIKDVHNKIIGRE